MSLYELIFCFKGYRLFRYTVIVDTTKKLGNLSTTTTKNSIPFLQWYATFGGHFFPNFRALENAKNMQLVCLACPPSTITFLCTVLFCSFDIVVQKWPAPHFNSITNSALGLTMYSAAFALSTCHLSTFCFFSSSFHNTNSHMRRASLL